VQKVSLGPMAPRCTYRQVIVPNYSQRQEVIWIKKVMSCCPASSRSCHDIMYPHISAPEKDSKIHYIKQFWHHMDMSSLNAYILYIKKNTSEKKDSGSYLNWLTT